MKRMMLAMLVIMAAVAVAAFPAFAQGGADVTKFGPCTTGIGQGVGERCHLTNTPSDNTNLQVHDNPQAPGRATGGGATQHEVNCGKQQGHGVVTPSGNVNVNCGGKA